jgi:hypothetical protein
MEAAHRPAHLFPQGTSATKMLEQTKISSSDYFKVGVSLLQIVMSLNI